MKGPTYAKCVARIIRRRDLLADEQDTLLDRRLWRPSRLFVMKAYRKWKGPEPPSRFYADSKIGGSVSVTRWITSQIGAREHYAVARALHGRGLLREMHTDIWCRMGRGLLRRGPSMTRSIAERWNHDIPSSLVRSYSLEFGLLEYRVGRQARRLPSPGGVYDAFISIGRHFAQRVARDLEHRTLNAGDIFFGYNTGCLETLEFLKGKGVATIVDQIDPGKVEYDLVREESARWPGWSEEKMDVPTTYLSRLSNEWQLSDMVIVNSEWSRQALIQQGVAADKIEIVPLAYESNVQGRQRENTRKDPLHVLWLGSVILRKGIPYLLEAAKALAGEAIRITVAGPLGISEDIVRNAPSNVQFIGRITRDRAAELYASADVFVLPTISDGFAITQIEAMAHGLPVIATPNCAHVVTDRSDGFIVPVRDAISLAEKIVLLEKDRELLRELSGNAIIKARQYSLSNLAEHLVRCGDIVTRRRA